MLALYIGEQHERVKNFMLKIVSEYDQKYHNHKLQINPWQCEEAQQNIYNNSTSESLDDCKTIRK